MYCMCIIITCMPDQFGGGTIEFNMCTTKCHVTVHAITESCLLIVMLLLCVSKQKKQSH